eukprot:UN21526
MSYIFHISHVWKYSKPTELHFFKVTLQNKFFKGFYFKNLPPGFTDMTVVMKLSLVESPPLNVSSHERSFTEHTIKKNVHVTAR